MARIPHRPAELVGQIFRGSDAVRRGLLTQSQLTGSAWRRIFRDVYVDADRPDSHELRCEGAGLLLPDGAALTGRSAACLAGLPLGERHEPVSVIVPPPGRLQGRGLRVSRTALSPAEIRPGTPPTTVPLRTAWEIARESNRPNAVAGLDVLLAHGYVGEAELRSRANDHPNTQPARTIRLTDGRSGSQPESHLRVQLVEAGFPPPVPQFLIRTGDDAVPIDLGWPGLRLGINYYRDRRRFDADTRRRNAQAEVGWTVFAAGPEELSDFDCFDRLCAYLTSTMRRLRDEAL